MDETLLTSKAIDLLLELQKAVAKAEAALPQHTIIDLDSILGIEICAPIIVRYFREFELFKYEEKSRGITTGNAGKDS